MTRSSDFETHYVPVISAKAFVHKHKTGRQIFMRVSGMMYSEPPTEESGGRGYDLPENVKVSQAAANEVFASQAKFAKIRKDEDGVDLQIRIVLCDNCIFIG